MKVSKSVNGNLALSIVRKDIIEAEYAGTMIPDTMKTQIFAILEDTIFGLWQQPEIEKIELKGNILIAYLGGVDTRTLDSVMPDFDVIQH